MKCVIAVLLCASLSDFVPPNQVKSPLKPTHHTPARPQASLSSGWPNLPAKTQAGSSGKSSRHYGPVKSVTYIQAPV